MSPASQSEQGLLQGCTLCLELTIALAPSTKGCVADRPWWPGSPCMCGKGLHAFKHLPTLLRNSSPLAINQRWEEADISNLPQTQND
jgi:hypothetical protein